MTDLIGWGFLAVIAVTFLSLYRFITSPGRRLYRALGEGGALGARRISITSPERRWLLETLRPFFGEHGKDFRLGTVYQTAGGRGYLLSMVEIARSGSETSYTDSDKCVSLVPTGLACGFSVAPSLAGNALARLALKWMEGRGVLASPVINGLLPEFQRRFQVYGDGPDGILVARRLQQTFLDAGFDLASSVAFSPLGFVIHLSPHFRPRGPADVRPVLDFAGRLESALRPA